MQSTVVLLLLTISSCILHTAALIPTVCTANATKEVSVCCPTPPGASAPCGGKGRGQCTRISAYKQYEQLHPQLSSDDRMLWPTRFFKFSCQCDARFWGFDCGECFFGWAGPRCQRRDIRVRRNVFTFNTCERQKYLQITKLLRQTMSPYSVLIEKHNNKSDPVLSPQFVPATVHYWLVYLHRYASRTTLFADADKCEKYGKLNLNHQGPGFITWHRYFTMTLERELHRLAVRHFNWTDFALPYWDWTDATWCEVCHNELIGAPGSCDKAGQRLHEESPFLNWEEHCTKPAGKDACYGCHVKPKFRKLVRQWKSLAFPTSAEVEYALSLPLYYIPGEFTSHNPRDCSFSRFLEGHCAPPQFMNRKGTLHNKVHNSVIGSLCCSSTAPNDPLFFLHHSQISRIVHMWQLCHGQSVQAMANTDSVPGHSRQDFMVGFLPPIRHEEVFTDSESLGYTYDSLEFGEKLRQRLQRLGMMPTPTLDHFKTCIPGYLHPQHALHSQHFKEELAHFQRQFPKPRAEL